MSQYSALEQFSTSLKAAKTIGEVKLALGEMGLDLSSFESLTVSAKKFAGGIGSHPSRCLVRRDLERLILNCFEPADTSRFENLGLRYFD